MTIIENTVDLRQSLETHQYINLTLRNEHSNILHVITDDVRIAVK